MLSRTIAIISFLILTVAVTADPPCRQVVPHSINAATIYHQTHLQIVEVPVPAFFFQTLQAYQTPVQDSVEPVNSGIGSTEQLLKLLDGLASAQNAPISTPIEEIRQKCSQCHNSVAGSKAGLRLFNDAGEYSPVSSNKALTRQMIAMRARSTGDDAMPPAARLDPSRRLSETAAAYLER